MYLMIWILRTGRVNAEDIAQCESRPKSKTICMHALYVLIGRLLESVKRCYFRLSLKHAQCMPLCPAVGGSDTAVTQQRGLCIQNPGTMLLVAMAPKIYINAR